ncbi:MAG: hypothetical protein IT347_07705 [Candidatus Eisenbacteria bacterium]|nr:hypothetical protein [Candidatus Eisenbacteria bacterium]
MPERAPSPSLTSQLRRRHAAVRRALATRHALRAAAACAVLLAVAFSIGIALPAGPGGSLARLVLLGAASLSALALAVRAFAADAPRFADWLEVIERRFPALRSWLRNALDLESGRDAHTSGELASALAAEAGQRFAAEPLAGAKPPIAARAPLAAIGASAALIVALGLIVPQAALRSWRTLWDPGAAAPPVTLDVTPGSVRLSPGATLAIRARVGGTDSAPKLLGDGPSPAPVLESEAGDARRWRFDLPPVTRARQYAVRVLRTESDRYAITLAGEPQPVSFSFEYRAPAYARLPVQSGASTRGDLTALRGSLARIEVTFDRDLEALSATLPGQKPAAWAEVTPRRWRGQVRVDGDGMWTLAASSSTGGAKWRYRVAALADAPPLITVAAPEGDGDLPAGSQVPFDVIAQDDLGLSDLRLQFRKDAAAPWREVPLSSFPGEPREARVAAAWDAGALALLPGESGTFRFEVRDNNRIGGPSRAVSREFHLRFPTISELYTSLDQGQERVQQSLQKVADQARELQKSLDQLQRQQPRPGMQSSPQYERAEEMKRATERQQELSRQIDRAAQDMRQQLSDAAERQAFRAELQDKLREMSELMRQIQSPEFRDALERMKKALEQMDRRTLEQTLPEMREQNRDLLKNLERSLALLKQLRDEEKLDALANRADELKKRQDAMNREHGERANAGEPRTPREQASADRNREAERQRDAAERSRELAKDARESAGQMNGEQAKSDLEQAAGQLEQQAATQQDQAAQESESGQDSKAQRSGEQASQSLAQAAQSMRRSSQSAQARRSAEQLAAVRRAAQDLVSLGTEASTTPQDGRTPEQQAGRQTDLSEGVARIADSLGVLSEQTPFLSPKVSEALGRAMQGLSQSGREMSQGNRARSEQSNGAARAALAEAVNALRESEASMCNRPGQQPGGQSGSGRSQQMQGLGQRQDQLNQRSRELARRLSEQMRLSEGDAAEMRRLADEQGRIRSELEAVEAEEAQRRQLLGRLDQTRRDMQEVEEQLRDGQPGDDLEERQNRILSRMLDAARSLNRRDYDPQRESRTGVDAARPSPAELPPSLLRENDRLRFDLLKADADRYPSQYRAFIESYLQRLNGSPK